MKAQGQVIHYCDERVNLPVNKPDEDYGLVAQDIFVVTDGVTLAYQSPYPNPSPARRSAEIVAYELMTTVQQLIATENPENILPQAFAQASAAVEAYNAELGITPETINYVDKQYAACVASAAFIVEGRLYWGQINDCGLMLLARNGDVIRHQVVDSAKHVRFVKHLQKLDPTRDGKGEHVYFRREVVNKRVAFEQGEVDFGVITGEETALDFVKYGVWDLAPNQTLVLHSDGFTPLLRDPVLRTMISIQMPHTEFDMQVKQLMINQPANQKEKTLAIGAIFA
jgi:hypothetical protein